MFLKSALVVAALFVAELVFYIFAAGYFNPLAVTLLSIALSAIGLWFLARQAPGLVMRTVQDVADGINQQVADQLGAGVASNTKQTAGLDQGLVANRAVKIFAAGLLTFPGLLTGFVGMLLFVGPVRGVVASLLGSRLASLLPAGALGGRSSVRHGFSNDVVDVTSTVKDPAPTSSSASGSDSQQRSGPGELPSRTV